MKILMICTLFPLQDGNEYLTNDMANALVSEGHEVQVLVIDWNASQGSEASEVTLENGVRVLAFSPRAINGLGRVVSRSSKWLLSSIFAALEMRRRLAGRHFDALICFPTVTAVAALVLTAFRRFKPRSYLVQWDFFPFHHRDIGLITNPLIVRVAHLVEQHLIRMFDVIGCMSPMNVDYLKKHYRLRPAQRVEVLRIWGPTEHAPAEPRDVVRARYRITLTDRIVLFGGQMSEGRGIEDILRTADLAAQEGKADLKFLMIGDGRLSSMIEAHISAGGNNVIYRKRVPRSDYISLASACDVGIVATVREVDVPTFPSKIIDYLRAGIPVIASVEKSTDYGDFVVQRGVGLTTAAGDIAGTLLAIETITRDPVKAAAIIAAGKTCLVEDFSVLQAARVVETSIAAVP